MQIADLVISQYGWAAYESMTLDEAIVLLPVIRNRKFSEYKMLLAITQNPHTKQPEDLWKLLDVDKEYLEEDLDKAGMERLKLMMGQSKGVKIN
jgi:hypothetical protein